MADQPAPPKDRPGPGAPVAPGASQGPLSLDDAALDRVTGGSGTGGLPPEDILFSDSMLNVRPAAPVLRSVGQFLTGR